MKILLLMIVAASTSAFPAPEARSRQIRSAEQNLGNLEKWDQAAAAAYLGNFGYMSKSRVRSAELEGLVDKKSFAKSIKEFQRMAGVKPTGQLNKETIRMMSMSRCGVEDTVGAFMMGSTGKEAETKFVTKKQKRERRRRNLRSGSKRRPKRYNLQGGIWEKTDLKYHIENYTPDLSRAEVDDSISRALNIWANYSMLTFSQTNNAKEADINIAFRKGDHGDYYPFDGKSGVLAHAFFPSSGKAHFDDDEKYNFQGGSGVNLFTVAAHEFGHSLGLAHSSVPNSLMAPFYQGYVPNYTLHDDDIAGIQQLYGKKMEKKEKTPPPPPPRNMKPTKRGAMNVCGANLTFDSMFFDHSANAMYALKGIYYWKIKDDGVAEGYPQKIKMFWKGLPGNIQAAVYSKTTQRTYFFKGSRVWRYGPNRHLEDGFPRRTSELALPSNLDAAMQWGSDGKIYAFKGEKFYRFSEYRRYDGVRLESSKLISKFWDGVPSSLDGAIQWKNGKTYFFKGNDYWRYSGMKKKMDPNYPRGVKKYWIGCANKTNPDDRFRISPRANNLRNSRRRPRSVRVSPTSN